MRVDFTPHFRCRIFVLNSHVRSISKRVSTVILEQIAPEIAAQYDLENVVLIIGPEICGDCRMTMKLLEKKGITSIKHVVDDREHPVLVALRAHLGLEPDAPVPLPAVFVKGEFRWNGGVNGYAIHELANELELAA